MTDKIVGSKRVIENPRPTYEEACRIAAARAREQVQAMDPPPECPEHEIDEQAHTLVRELLGLDETVPWTYGWYNRPPEELLPNG